METLNVEIMKRSAESEIMKDSTEHKLEVAQMVIKHLKQCTLELDEELKSLKGNSSSGQAFHVAGHHIGVAVKKEPEITMRLMGIMYRALDKVFGFKVPVVTAGEWNKFLTSEQGVSARKKFDQVAMNHPEILNPLYDYHAATILLKKLKK